MKANRVRRRLFRQRRFRQVLFGLIVISIVLGLIIVPIEQEFGMIQTPGDGLWWATSTLTTVGYGDLVPVTPLGRAIGIVLQLVGAIMFGVIIALIGIAMNRPQDEYYWNRLFDRLNQLEDNMTGLKKQSEFMVKGKKTEVEVNDLASALKKAKEDS